MTPKLNSNLKFPLNKLWIMTSQLVTVMGAQLVGGCIPCFLFFDGWGPTSTRSNIKCTYITLTLYVGDQWCTEKQVLLHWAPGRHGRGNLSSNVHGPSAEYVANSNILLVGHICWLKWQDFRSVSQKVFKGGGAIIANALTVKSKKKRKKVVSWCH